MSNYTKICILLMYAKVIVSFTPFEQISNTLDDHLRLFNMKHEQSFAGFLERELANYPMPVAPGLVPSNPLERNEWLNNQFDGYVKDIKQKATKFGQELKLFDSLSIGILNNIMLIDSHDDLQKLLDLPRIQQIKHRFKIYRDSYTHGKSAVDNKFQQNINIESDPLKGPATLSEYKQRQREFTDFLQLMLDTPLFNAQNALRVIEEKVAFQRDRIPTK